MKRRHSQWIATCLFLLTTSLHGELLVYRGTTRNAPYLPKRYGAYLVLDTATWQGAIVTFGKVDGQKKFFLEKPVTFKNTNYELPNGKTGIALSFLTGGDNGAGSFFHFLQNLRGTNASVIARTEPMKEKITRPRLLKGQWFYHSSDEGAPFLHERQMSFTLLGSRTIAANNAEMEIQNVVEELAEDLKAKKYSPPSSDLDP